MASMYSDTQFLQQISGLKINSDQVNTKVKADLIKQKSSIVLALNRAVMERKLKKIVFIQLGYSWIWNQKKQHNCCMNLRDINPC